MQKVYSSAGENEYLVTLLVNPDDTDLDRMVFNSLYAKYECRKAKVINIEHKTTGKALLHIKGNDDFWFTYKVGETVEKYRDDTLFVMTSPYKTKHIYIYTTIARAFLEGHQPNNGPYKLWHSNGHVYIECEYENGKIKGKYKEWYDNGSLAVKCDYINGNKHGQYKEYDEQENLLFEYKYKNGELEGPYKKYYENGQLKVIGEYTNGERNGPYKKWYYNGKLMIERNYKNGECESPYKQWDWEGKLSYVD